MIFIQGIPIPEEYCVETEPLYFKKLLDFYPEYATKAIKYGHKPYSMQSYVLHVCEELERKQLIADSCKVFRLYIKGGA